MNELITNLHMHTLYSDGSGTHQQLAKAALKQNIDVLLVTDHNLLVENINGYYKKDRHKLLLLTGEEIHDKSRIPPKNHLLVFGAEKELCTFADHTQNLINQVKRYNGLSFLAHPFEEALPQVHEDDISWVDWEVTGFTGLELWNHLSELKTRSTNWFLLIFHIFFPYFFTVGPDSRTVQKWDQLTMNGRKVVAIGGSDAHALEIKKTFIKRIVFPYAYHFSVINTHLLTPTPLTGDLLTDKKMVYQALADGKAFIGNDLPAPTKGFRFNAQGTNQTAIMGESIVLQNGVTFQINLPEKCECNLIHNGKIVKTWNKQKICTYITKEPGVYRVEAYLNYLGRKRAWIFSNPIYVSQTHSGVL
ncbi:MAG: hypothetical protein CL609_21100 [Anaerolineaceae bacterium]|nr:hypothetical protein [Anaerolineaceae bacterium]